MIIFALYGESYKYGNDTPEKVYNQIFLLNTC